MDSVIVQSTCVATVGIGCVALWAAKRPIPVYLGLLGACTSAQLGSATAQNFATKIYHNEHLSSSIESVSSICINSLLAGSAAYLLMRTLKRLPSLHVKDCLAAITFFGNTLVAAYKGGRESADMFEIADAVSSAGTIAVMIVALSLAYLRSSIRILSPLAICSGMMWAYGNLQWYSKPEWHSASHAASMTVVALVVLLAWEESFKSQDFLSV